ncbi:MAG: hypothetical protein IJH78_05895 [Clostridia bacterium]|nr:hypothetical protein [Clostridia bacterium]
MAKLRMKKRQERAAFLCGMLTGLLALAALMLFSQRAAAPAGPEASVDAMALEELGLPARVEKDYAAAAAFWRENREALERSYTVLREACNSFYLRGVMDIDHLRLDDRTRDFLVSNGLREISFERDGSMFIELYGWGMVSSGFEYGFCWSPDGVPTLFGYTVISEKDPMRSVGGWHAPPAFDGDNFSVCRIIEGDLWFYWCAW